MTDTNKVFFIVKNIQVLTNKSSQFKLKSKIGAYDLLYKKIYANDKIDAQNQFELFLKGELKK